MLFNSIEFAIFFPIVFLIYWIPLKKNIKLQNIFLLITSYFFYAMWNWKFLILIITSSITAYLTGIKIYKAKKKIIKKRYLLISLFINLGLLFIFKYYNFFISNLNEFFTILGHRANISSLEIILPVGISFYTFQTLSYSIDIFKKKIKPTRDLVSFFAFVSFFPQLVAGPIERASHLIPQFLQKRTLKFQDYSLGMRQILWGLFKKIVIADNAAEYVNYIFSNYSSLEASSLLLGVIFFSLQIYGDFSGYSDIAIGTARTLGFKLIDNFKYPYFSKNIREFWQKWHISLTSWFRDYIYIPLGGNRNGIIRQSLNTFVVFLISGIWHGANWTFIIWGILHGSLIIASKKKELNLNTNKYISLVIDSLKTLKTFLVVSILWIFFRSEDIIQAIEYLKGLINKSIINRPTVFPKYLIILSIVMFIFELLNKDNSNTLDWEKSFLKNNRWLRWSIYLSIVLLIVGFGKFSKTEFIYFAF